MKSTIIISLLIFCAVAYLDEKIQAMEWLIDQNYKSFEKFLKETIEEQEVAVSTTE